MKVRFLGAGASKAAGYPLTRELLGCLKDFCEHASIDALERDWATFEAFKSRSGDAMAPLLGSANLEIFLSVIDLYLAAAEEFPLRASELQKSEDDELAGLITNPAAQGALLARTSLLRCLKDFFGWLHERDSLERKGEYLKDEFRSLGQGDIVITTNWDCLAERTLLETDRWSPCDGFGFDVFFKNWSGKDLPPAITRPSAVKVLKLHGSFGWSVRPDKRIYLRYTDFLRPLLPLSPDIQDARDKREPPYPPLGEEQLFVYPSFLKRLEHPEMLKIWVQAQSALLKADEIRVAGYSLPMSDTAIRVLFNIVRERLQRKQVSVVIDEPADVAIARWKNFLPDAEFSKRPWG